MYATVDRDRGEIIKKFADQGIVLTSHGFERIVSHNLNLEEVIFAAKKKNVWLVADEFLREFIDEKNRELEREKAEITEVEKLPKKVQVERKKHIFAKEIDSELKIHEETDVTGKSTCEGLLENFMDYFNQKYDSLRGILKDRENLKAAVPIKMVRKYMGEDNIHIIAMVSSKRESKKGYRFLEVEDPTGELTVLVPGNNRQLNQMYDNILLDEVIGISGRLNRDLFIAGEIYQPDLPINNKTRSADEPIHIALLSDIHVGSYLFLEKEFNRFIDCLNLKGNNSEIFEKVKYILVAGDLVDGIGIYPNQEKELSIPDIYKQYDFLASLLEKVPDYIEIVLAMGNHDAVRNAEPQPRLDRDVGAPLYDLPNVHMVGNPVMVSTHGVKTLMYHGTSLDTMIGNLSSCTYSRPETTMIEYLKRRYLIPVYGNDYISPEKKDYLTIKEIPDIFHSGHIHTNGYANYKGVKVINSGTWQARTRYQEELGHLPTPGRVPIMNLQNHEVSVIHF